MTTAEPRLASTAPAALEGMVVVVGDEVPDAVPLAGGTTVVW